MIGHALRRAWLVSGFGLESGLGLGLGLGFHGAQAHGWLGALRLQLLLEGLLDLQPYVIGDATVCDAACNPT